MKRFIFLISLLLVGCGGAQLTESGAGLPFFVTPQSELQEATIIAIDGLNEALGYALELGDEGNIEVRCDTEHKYTGGQTVGVCYGNEVLLDCERQMPMEKKALVVAHELFHCIGFLDHYEDPSCLNYEMSPASGAVEDAVCDEMKADFVEKYGDLQ